MISANP